MKRNTELKRSPLNRGTKQMKRTRLKPKRRRGDNAALRTNQEHAWYPNCACCGREEQFDLEVDVHHILSGAYGRPDHPANLLTLCRRCHDLVHDNKLTRAMQLTLYIEAQRAYLQSRMGNRILEQPEEVPEEFRRRM